MRSFVSRGSTVAGVLLLAAAFTASPASAWWRGGVWIGVPPVVVGPGPAYYPPYYAPPPTYGQSAAPPAQSQVPAQPQASTGAAPQTPVAYGGTCYAGVYVCPAPGYTPVGQTCTCPGLGAPSYGTVE
jgi:hypothetical protein